MKKFTKINETEVVEKVDIIESKIKELLSTLDIDIDGVDNPWDKVTVNTNENFNQKIKDLVNICYLKEKKEYLDMAKKSHFTKDVSWLDEEISAVNESIKKLK